MKRFSLLRGAGSLGLLDGGDGNGVEGLLRNLPQWLLHRPLEADRIFFRPRWLISRILRKRDTEATDNIERDEDGFSVGRDTKQSTTLGQGHRLQR